MALLPPSSHIQQSEIYFELHHREIRLVTLLRGQWDTEIHCRLFHAQLSNKPVYKALSYAWGSPRITRHILVNGTKHQVTVNLESALRRLRRPEKDLTLWVDALCIHQSNDAERTQQVNLMQDIFASTEEVLVYLGEVPTHDSTGSTRSTGVAGSVPSTVFSFDSGDEAKLEVFRNNCTTKRSSIRYKGKANVDFAFDVFCLIRLLAMGQPLETIPPFDADSQKCISKRYKRDLFEGLRHLMLCRWWNRIWVIQEVVVPLHVSVVYGSSVAPWMMFVSAALSYPRFQSVTPSLPNEYVSVIALFSRAVLDLSRMRQLWMDAKETTILPLLRRFSGRKATDDRDKVYALLTLVRDKWSSIVPDYSLTVAQVFQNTALSIIKNTISLHVLTGDIGRKDRQDLPSWCPDWSAPYVDFDRRRAENSAIYSVSYGSIIILQGLGVSELTGISQHLSSLETSAEFREIDHSNHIEYYKGMEGWKGWRIPQVQVEKLSGILNTADWTRFLPKKTLYPMSEEYWEESCHEAVENFLASQFRTGILRNHGDGVLSLPGVCIDTVAITGDISYSDGDLVSVVQSWVTLLVDHFKKNHFREIAHTPMYEVLGEAFRRTICADAMASSHHAISRPQRIGKTNTHADNMIAAWCLQGKGGSRHARERRLWYLKDLFNDLLKADQVNHTQQPGDHGSFLSGDFTDDVDAAIKSASIRRTFFITRKGYLGLGPPKTQVGDSLVILLGGQVPFILRKAGTRYFRKSRIVNGYERTCFEVIGDCYAHGIMDGEVAQGMKPDFGLNQNAYPPRDIAGCHLVIGADMLRKPSKIEMVEEIQYQRDYADFEDWEFPHFYLV